MEIRNATAPNDIALALTVDQAVMGSNARADYITSIAKVGGLNVAIWNGEIGGFSCLDNNYFFGKPFISLLIVAADARRQGLGGCLLSHHARALPDVWTSTNRSNMAMRQLLDKRGWHFCGEVDGLDEGDPERFYRAP